MKISIASGKGGTGKTTLAVNLAAYIAETDEVLLADLDVEEPNSGLFISGELVSGEEKFKMIPEWDEKSCILCGLCQQVCNFNAVIQLATQILVFPELCHGCYACSELCPGSSLPMVPRKMGTLKHFRLGKISFIESRLDIGQEQAVPLISQTDEYVDKHFQEDVFKLYDSPPGTSCPVIEATKNSDYVILVTEPTPFGLHDLELAVQTMKELGKDFGVVINRDGIGNDDVMNFCANNNIQVLARIPNSRRVAELYSRGQLVYPEIREVREQLEKIKSFILKLSPEVEK